MNLISWLFEDVFGNIVHGTSAYEDGNEIATIQVDEMGNVYGSDGNVELFGHTDESPDIDPLFLP